MSKLGKKNISSANIPCTTYCLKHNRQCSIEEPCIECVVEFNTTNELKELRELVIRLQDDLEAAQDKLGDAEDKYEKLKRKYCDLQAEVGPEGLSRANRKEEWRNSSY
jgi:chromosome segregation ATPase